MHCPIFGFWHPGMPVAAHCQQEVRRGMEVKLHSAIDCSFDMHCTIFGVWHLGMPVAAHRQQESRGVSDMQVHSAVPYPAGWASESDHERQDRCLFSLRNSLMTRAQRALEYLMSTLVLRRSTRGKGLSK